MSNRSNTSNDKSRTVQDIISEIEQKSKGGGYIYRGERKLHKEPPYNGKVSSNLWREYGIEAEHFNIELVQKEMLAAAKRHTGHLPQDFRVDVTALPSLKGESTEETIDFEILTEIQHYGGKTNLIDFTTDYFIALFFACDGRYNEDGRVILQKTAEIRDMIAHPRNPRHRVIAQKSVFIRPPRGFIEPDENDLVTIPANLKQPLVQHLRDYHGISTEIIYNDLYSFIRNQDFHGDAYTHFYRGFACGNRGDQETTFEAKQVEYENAIKHFTEAIRLKPDLAGAYFNRGVTYAFRGEFDDAVKDFDKVIQLQPDSAEPYNNRGEARLHLKEWEKAKLDLITAKDMGADIITTFHNDYASVEDFEQKTGIQLPEDIAELLTPQV